MIDFITGTNRMTRFIFITLVMVIFMGQAYAQNTDTIITDSTSKIDSTTKVESPPASAISPTINSSNSDLCTVGVAGAVQTQILGLSAGKTVRDMNCEKLKNAKTLYDMGMKVAAVSVMCQDKRVFDAMMNAGTPCPYDGLIGPEAKAAWKNNEEKMPKQEEARSVMDDDSLVTLIGGSLVLGLFILLSIL